VEMCNFLLIKRKKTGRQGEGAITPCPFDPPFV